jgi:hypothetical protein
LLGGIAVSSDEPVIGIPQLAANGTGRGMDGRCGGPLGLERLALGILAQDGGGSERLDSGALSMDGGFPLDLRHQRGGLLLSLLRREVLPAGKRIELQGFAGRILEAADIFPATAGPVLLGAIEPSALQALPLRQRLDAVDARPVLETFDKALLAAVAEHVLEARGLGFGLRADQDGLIPPSKNLLPPAGEASDLPGELGVEVIHEARELPGVVHLQDQMEMIGGEGESADPHRVETLRPGDGSQDDRIEDRSRAKQEAAVERPAGHLDQGARVWDETKSSAHADL